MPKGPEEKVGGAKRVNRMNQTSQKWKTPSYDLGWGERTEQSPENSVKGKRIFSFGKSSLQEPAVEQDHNISFFSEEKTSDAGNHILWNMVNWREGVNKDSVNAKDLENMRSAEKEIPQICYSCQENPGL